MDLVVNPFEFEDVAVEKAKIIAEIVNSSFRDYVKKYGKQINTWGDVYFAIMGTAAMRYTGKDYLYCAEHLWEIFHEKNLLNIVACYITY